MSDPKRLHPIVIVTTIGKRLKDFIFTFIAFFFIVSNKGEYGGFIVFAVIALAVCLIIINSILSWLRYTYRLEQGELRIEYGIIVRKKRYIPLERIQSLNISEGVLQRLFGMVKVQIETAGAGGEEAEAVLSAISKEEASLIGEYVTSSKNERNHPAELGQNQQLVYKITRFQLILLSLTSGGAGVVISAVLAFLSQFDEFIPYERLFRQVETWAVSNIIFISVLVLIGLLLAWVLALLGTMLKYANFIVMKTQQDLIISQGLLERRQITIPLKRIQAIRINENIIRQILGYGSVIVESAGGSINNQEGSKVMLLPLVKLRDIESIITPAIPDYEMKLDFSPIPKRALGRYIFRTWLVIIPLVLVAVIFLKAWGLLSLIVLGIATLWAYLKYKDAGWRVEQEQLNLRYRTWVRTTVFTKKSRIQSLELKESFFQRKQKLASIETFVKAGFGDAGGRVVDLDRNDVETIFTWYSRKQRD